MKVIYTALTKGYDDLLQPEALRSDYDYICFSNDFSEDHIGVWQIRRIPYPSANKTRLTRFPKLNPHLVLSDYAYSVWADANLRITEAIYDRVDELISEGAVCALCPHPDRTTPYEEARALIRSHIGEPELVYQQARFLLEVGYMPRDRLHYCSLMYRAHHDPGVIAFSAAWWDQYCRFSCRDQMGVNYAVRLAELHPAHFFSSGFVADHTRNYKLPNIHNAVRFEGCWIELLFRKVIRFLRGTFYVFKLRKLYARHGVPCA